MINFSDYISVLWFFIALVITLILVNILKPKQNIVIKEVSLSNHQDLVFRRKDNTCYKYNKEEVQCNSTNNN